MYSTLYEAICAPGRNAHTAIEGIEKMPITYAGLKAQVDAMICALHDMGYCHSSRIAVMLPDGPEMAVAVLLVASGFTCAPLNPRYTAKELDFYLTDMSAEAIIVPADMADIQVPAGVSRIDYYPDREYAGVFYLNGERHAAGSDVTLPGPDSVAMVIHTSGTTSRPKLVPILQSSLMASAHQTAASLSLCEADKCLNVMPLFHVHGLLGAVLSTLVSGGSVVCTPGFKPDTFHGLLKEFMPTWYTAVPAVHRHVLERTSPESRKTSLRFIRSCSATLPPSVMKGLEDAFGVPVIEAFGMTEGPHQIAANPLPPLARRPGSVGKATGVEISIVDDEWRHLPAGSAGEIVLKGSRILKGYEKNPEANEKAFRDGWFRTGDHGYIDPDGYLFIDGRIKEIINKGGEKVSPREIEEALLSHPAVAETAVFSIPDPSLGENVGAAIVLKNGFSAGEDEIKRHAGGTLAYYKLPAKIWLMDVIPKGPTGKVQRVGMYDRLAALSSSCTSYEPPATPTERSLAGIWSQVLNRENIGRHDSFFEAGGDSLRATMVVTRVQRDLGVRLSVAVVMDYDTIAMLAEYLDGLKGGQQ